jgi:hypothetical protein
MRRGSRINGVLGLGFSDTDGERCGSGGLEAEGSGEADQLRRQARPCRPKPGQDGA